MAYWRRRRGNQVLVTYLKDGKHVAVPRAQIKHLDYEPDHNVEFWVKQWEAQNGIKSPPSTVQLTEYVDKFIAYYRDDLKRHHQTFQEHRRHLLNHVIPFFITKGPKFSDPSSWPSVSVQMLSGLREQGLTDGQINRCNIALRKFYLWLTEEKLIFGDGKILVRSPVREKGVKDTPLKHVLAPDDVLKLAHEQNDLDLRLVVLFGYFFSLRSQETFGLLVSDLRAGQTVLNLESSKTMKSLGLYPGMAINITRQKDKQLKIGLPKNNSKGWVNCFHKEAAIMIVEALKDRKPEESVIIKRPIDIYHAWPYEFSIKDLRRASLYWLGHNTAVTSIQLGKHARQKSEEALRLYLRRPEEELEGFSTLQIVDL